MCFSEDERPALSGLAETVLGQSEPCFANTIFFAPPSTTSSLQRCSFCSPSPSFAVAFVFSIQNSSPRWLILSTMGKINLTALRVRQTALNQFASGKISKLPQWVDVISEIPPAETLIRTRPPQHQLVQQRMKTVAGSSKPQAVFEFQEKRRKPRKASRLFQPVEIKYEEDQLRTEFFRDHPWELARPRLLLESSGKDFEHHDWSRIQQPGKRLDGERYIFLSLAFSAGSFHITRTCFDTNTRSSLLVLSSDNCGF